MSYLQLLKDFVLHTLFDKDEYVITSKRFNPLKVILMIILISNTGLTVFLLSKLHLIHDRIETTCPAYFEKYDVEESKKKILEFLRKKK